MQAWADYLEVFLLAKGSPLFSCSGLAEMLRYRMESSGPNDRSEVKADSDLANELKLWDEWKVLVGQRSNWKKIMMV